jgi:diketogulonate reductase-like aldo/keto reductase
MHSLDDLVKAGKVLYLGISDTPGLHRPPDLRTTKLLKHQSIHPAWIVAKANQYARDHGLRPFSVYQGLWSAVTRDFEREIIPMCHAEGMGIAPWGSLGRGHFKDPADTDKGRNMGGPSDAYVAVSKVLSRIAKEKSVPVTSVAMAYVMHKTPYVFPIVGGRKIEHLKGNIEALGLELSEKDMEDIDGATPFELGFPHNFLSHKKNGAEIGPGDVWLSHNFVNADYVEPPKAISHGKHK